MYHANLNVNLVVENVIQIKSGIMINADVTTKNIFVKRIIFGILLHVVAKVVNVQQVILTIHRLRVMKLQTWKVSRMKKKQNPFQKI